MEKTLKVWDVRYDVYKKDMDCVHHSPYGVEAYSDADGSRQDTNNCNVTTTDFSSSPPNNNFLSIIDSPNLVIDMISNLKIRKGTSIPFILSPHEFDYGIQRKIKIELDKMVKNAGENEFMYKSNGMVFMGDWDFIKHIGVLDEGRINYRLDEGVTIGGQ